jgi:hypothetical protein
VIDRFQVLRSLVKLDRPLDEITAILQGYAWETDSYMVVLTTGDLIGVLNRFVSGELSQFDVESWANAIESREDIEFEAGHENSINDIIFQLANPYLSAPLTKEIAQGFIRRFADRIRSGDHE